METDNNGAQGAQPSVVKPIWEVMGGQQDVVTITPEAQTAANQTTDVVDPPVIDEPAKVDPPVVAEVDKPKTETDIKVEDVKVEPVVEATVDPILELKVEDIKDAPTSYEDGTFQALGEDFGLTLPEESYDAFKKEHDAKYVLRSEIEKMVPASKEELFKTLDPKLATAFELIDLGVPPELALNPTKEHDEWLARPSAEVVRAKLMNQYNNDEELVDARMEEISADPQKLEIQAKLIKADISVERNQILQDQTQIAQKLTAQRQQTAIQQKTEQANQFKEALTKESAFMGLPLSKEVKAVILSKYEKGLYETALNPAQAQLRAILQLEYGEKFAKAVQSKAKEEGKAEITKRLADVPPKVNQGGGRQQVVIDNQTNDKHPFAYMPGI